MRRSLHALVLLPMSLACMELPKDAPPDALSGAAAPATPAAPAPTGSIVAPPDAGTPPPEPELAPLFDGAVVSSPRAAPIAGGSLTVTRDGTTVLAADADRDRVFVVDLATEGVRAIATEPGEQPGRVVEGAAGTAYVAARRGGAVLVLELASATVRGRLALCSDPRGLAYDHEHDLLHVACRSGALVSVEGATGEVVRRLQLDPDLRDVVINGDELVVTRWKDAEVMVVASDGSVGRRGKPNALGHAAVAFRGVFHAASGMMLLAHQVESDASLGSGFGAYYGSDCGGVVQPTLTSFAVAAGAETTVTTDPPVAGDPPATSEPLELTSQSRTIPAVVGPVDLAISPDGQKLALIGSGNSWNVNGWRPNVFVVPLNIDDGQPTSGEPTDTCVPILKTDDGSASAARVAEGEPVAVAFDAAGRVLVQSREPAQLELEGGAIIALSDESRADTGLAMFHMNSSGGIACSSCHPEGHEDGHTWLFAEFGQRRSQALAGGVSSRSPFHWIGDLTTFHDFLSEVMMARMALPRRISLEQEGALLSWLDRLPAIPPDEGLDAGAVERGRTLFFDARIRCDRCHAGADYTDNRLYDVGTGEALITPSLVGVSHRLPLMHDGCATTLRARFGACGGDERHNPPLAAAEIDDMVEFLRSL